MTAIPKYYVRKVSGETISEPCVVFRAQDRYSTYMLARYIEFLEHKVIQIGSDYTEGLRTLLYDMMEWQALHPDKVKDPD